MRGLLRGLMVAGLASLGFAIADITAYYIVVTYVFRAYPGVYGLVTGILAGVASLILLRYFMHVAVDSIHLIYLVKRGLVRLDTCGGDH